MTFASAFLSGWIFMAIMAGIHTAGAGRVTGPIVFAVIGLIGAWAFYRMFIYSKILVNASGLEVCNPFRRPIRIAWKDISAISTSSTGLLILENSGKTIRAWAVQKTEAWSMLGRRSRSDEIVDRMSQTASAALGEPRDFARRP